MKTINEYFNDHQMGSTHSIVEARGEYKIYLKNASAFVIYLCELAGQVSDGYWENSRPYDHWKWVTTCEPVIDKDKEYYTGYGHRIKYSTEWLRRYVKKALKGNAGDYSWAIRVFNYAKMASVTPEDKIKKLVNGYDAWRSICEDLPQEPITSEELEKRYATSDYRKKYWEKAGKEYFNDELLKKYYDSKYDWSDFEDDLESATTSMNTSI